MKAYIWGVLLAIDGGIYDFICYLFEIFYYLCGLQLFSDTDYNALIQRVYVILGLIMMFVLAYSLLRAVINPDEFAKGETSFPKLIQNVIVSLIIIVFLPTAFQTAFSIQNSLLNYDTIPQLILGEGSSATGTTGPTVQNVSGGRAIAFYTFKAFLFPDLSSGNVSCSYDDPDKCRDQIHGNGALTVTDGPLLTERDKAVLEGKNSFTIYGNYSESVRDHKLTYYFPISTVAGIFMAYVMLNFCFDMALRVVKLAFYQIIAPIPVICRIIPGGKLKDVFSKWLKQVISLFVEVFVRIGALSFGVFLIGIIIDKFEAGLDGIGMLTGFGQRTIVLALLLMSVIIFVKEIPKIIGDMFGLDTGGMKLGLMDKLAAGGALAAGAFLGGGVKTMAGNAVSKFANKKNWLNDEGKLTAGSVLKNLGAGVASGTAGGLSGAFRSGKAGLKSKNFADMRKASADGSKAAIEKRVKRGNYIAQHSAGKGFVDDVVRSMGGHISDAARGVTNWAGYKNLDQMQAENVAMDEIMSAKDTFNDNTDAYITKELAKWDGKSDIVGGLEKADVQNLRKLENDLAKARVEGVGVADAEKAFNDAMRSARATVQTNVATSQKNWANLSDSERAKLSGLRVDATKYVGAVNKNAALDAVQSAFNSNDNKSGIANPKDFNFENGLDFTKDDFKDLVDNMEDLMKIKKGDNNVEIAMRSQTEPENKK